MNLTPINPAIVNRGYQIEAIRRVGEAFAQGKRKALVVMATGGAEGDQPRHAAPAVARTHGGHL